MSSTARKLLKDALKLTAKERAAFAGSLIWSLEEKVDADVAEAWAAEIERRVKDIDDGKTKLIPWSQVRRELYAKLSKPQHGSR